MDTPDDNLTEDHSEGPDGRCGSGNSAYPLRNRSRSVEFQLGAIAQIGPYVPVRLTYQYFMPITRISRPKKQAAAIAFLASDEVWYIHGVALDVTGDRFMA